MTAKTPFRAEIFGPIAASAAFVLELSLVPLLLPSIQSQFEASIRELAWVFNAYGIGVALGVVIAGVFGGMARTKSLFNFGAVLFALGSGMLALAASLETLVAWRAIQGLGAGIFYPLVPLLLTRATPDRPGRVLMVWGSVSGYIAAIAPFFFSGALQSFDWRLLFLIIGGVAIVPNLILPKRNSVRERPERPSSKTAYRALFRSYKLWLMMAYVFCTYGVFTYFLFIFPIRLSASGFEAFGIGLFVSTLWISFAVASTLLRNWVDGALGAKILCTAPLLIAFGVSGTFIRDEPALLALSAVLAGLGLACSNGPSTQFILRFAPDGMGAVCTSLDITFARIGGAVTVALLAQASTFVVETSVVLICACSLVCALIVVRRGNGGVSPVPKTAV